MRNQLATAYPLPSYVAHLASIDVSKSSRVFDRRLEVCKLSGVDFVMEDCDSDVVRHTRHSGWRLAVWLFPVVPDTNMTDGGTREISAMERQT